jgi:hypothetical protein
MSVINHLLSQSLNNILWVILGLASWVGAYWQLYKMKSETFADVVTLVLGVLPLGVAFVSFRVMAARLSGKHHYEAWVFFVLGAASLLYAAWLYFTQSKVRKVFEDRAILNQSRPQVTASLVIKVLAGAISVLASVTLLIYGGWDLIQGWVLLGLILAPVGGGTLLLDRWPKGEIHVFGHNWHIILHAFGHNWRLNPFEVTYSALIKGKASPQSETASISSATAGH